MMVRSGLEHRVLNQPCAVYFAGFKSDTYRLQQAGWKLAVEQDVMYRRIRLALNFPPANLYMVAHAVDYEFYDLSYRPVEFHIQHCASRMTVELFESSFAFKPIDATPVVERRERKSIEDFKLFTEVQMARTEEIIVEPATVAELLDQIRKMQSPELARIRENQRRTHGAPGAEVVPFERTNFHAQIVSLAA